MERVKRHSFDSSFLLTLFTNNVLDNIQLRNINSSDYDLVPGVFFGSTRLLFIILSLLLCKASKDK